MVDTGSVLQGYECFSCAATFDRDLLAFQCPDCGGILDPQYRYASLNFDRSDWRLRGGSMWDYRELLPVFDDEYIVTAGEGDTPLIECPQLAAEIGVGRLLVKDEGQNPTNTFKDRGQSASISKANEANADAIGIPSAGNDGQSASLYSARAGVDCHVYLNTDADEVKQSLMGAHGATLHFSDGDITDAVAAFEADKEQRGLYSVATYQTPHKHDGMKTMLFEIVEQLDWSVPDHVVYPTGSGTGLIGMWKGYEELVELGLLDGHDPPGMNVAQSDGAAPIVRALEEGATEHTPWPNPRSIAKGIQIPDPTSSPLVIDRVTASGGHGVAIPDEKALEAALRMAETDGVEMCTEAAVALAGTIELARKGSFTRDDEVVVINTGAGCKTPEQLRDAIDARYRRASK